MPTRDDAWPDGTPCWVDVSVDDLVAARSFYSGLFGWDLQEGPPETGGYTMCLQQGRPAAAISAKMGGGASPTVWSTYLACDDVDAAVARARDAGGSILAEPMDVMSFGRMAFGADPSGAAYGLWQAGDHKGVGVYNEAGSMVWNELMTRDYEGAKAFYSAVFGYTYDEMGDGQGFTYSGLKRRDGNLVGGVGELGADVSGDVPSHWMTYFGVADTEATAARAAELGATIRKEPFDSTYGRVCVIEGPQGEVFSVISVSPEPPAADDPAPEVREASAEA